MRTRGSLPAQRTVCRVLKARDDERERTLDGGDALQAKARGVGKQGVGFHACSYGITRLPSPKDQEIQFSTLADSSGRGATYPTYLIGRACP